MAFAGRCVCHIVSHRSGRIRARVNGDAGSRSPPPVSQSVTLSAVGRQPTGRQTGLLLPPVGRAQFVCRSVGRSVNCTHLNGSPADGGANCERRPKPGGRNKQSERCSSQGRWLAGWLLSESVLTGFAFRYSVESWGHQQSERNNLGQI